MKAIGFRRVAGLLGLAGAATIGACSAGTTGPGGFNGGTGTGPTDSLAVAVGIADFTFSPQTITVKVGATVEWDNNGPSPHSVVSDANVWASTTLLPPTTPGGAGNSYRFIFTTPGTYTYHCSLHPPSSYPGFVGTVIVIP